MFASITPVEFLFVVLSRRVLSVLAIIEVGPRKDENPPDFNALVGDDVKDL